MAVTSSTWSALHGRIEKFQTKTPTKSATRLWESREESPGSKPKMDLLWQELAKRNIPISVVVYPWPAQIAHDTIDSKQVRIWRDWCAGKCKRFVSLFPAFFAVKEQCPKSEPGCWYLSHFIFGDTHYNSTGDALAADVIIRSLAEEPPTKRPLRISGPDSAKEAKGPARSSGRAHGGS